MIRLFAITSLTVWLAACSTVAPVAGLPATTGVTDAPLPVTFKPLVMATQIAAPDPDLYRLPAPADGTVERPADAMPLVELLAGEAPREFERGGASWYGPRFHGRRTASGERYNMHGFTAAHRTLPFGTMVRVRSLVNGREVDVRVTDRGPFSHQRVIDLSRGAAEALGMLGLGIKDVVLLVPDSTVAAVPLMPHAHKVRRPVHKAGSDAG